MVLAAAHDAVMEALLFYAMPGTYHAIAFVPDQPAGEFMDDFSDDHGDNFYQRPMPGDRARAAVRAWTEALHGPEEDDA